MDLIRRRVVRVDYQQRYQFLRTSCGENESRSEGRSIRKRKISLRAILATWFADSLPGMPMWLEINIKDTFGKGEVNKLDGGLTRRFGDGGLGERKEH